MSSREVAIAKVNFSAVLFRKDPTPLTRQDIESFHELLSAVLEQCSPANVQKCRRWIVAHLFPSQARVSAFVKYLAALSGSFSSEGGAAGGKVSKPSARRRHIHALYLLNDILYHSAVRERSDAFAKALEPSLRQFFHNAAAYRGCPKQMKKLAGLVDLWEGKKYFHATCTAQLRDTIREAPFSNEPKGSAQQKGAQGSTEQGGTSKSEKETPFLLPAMHGDPSTPWYDLPAANWLPHLTPNTATPMHPDMIKPLQLAAGKADAALVKAVKDLLSDSERLYSRKRKPGDHDHQVVDYNELGERVIIDEITGDVIGGETYYGWSREFCQKMKKRRKNEGQDLGRGRSRSDSF